MSRKYVRVRLPTNGHLSPFYMTQISPANPQLRRHSCGKTIYFSYFHCCDKLWNAKRRPSNGQATAKRRPSDSQAAFTGDVRLFQHLAICNSSGNGLFCRTSGDATANSQAKSALCKTGFRIIKKEEKEKETASTARWQHFQYNWPQQLTKGSPSTHTMFAIQVHKCKGIVSVKQQGMATPEVIQTRHLRDYSNAGSSLTSLRGNTTRRMM